MAEDTFKNFLIGFALFSLFGLLILGVVNQTGTTYGKDLNLVTGNMNISGFNNSVTNLENSANDFKERFVTGNIWSAIAGVVVTGIFGIARDMILLIVSPFALLSNIMINVLHIPTSVVSVALGILIISLIFALWQLIKIGN